MLAELGAVTKPMLVVIEDAHWADDATLDLVKFLGRRIERSRALLAVSFRDDEVGPSHPLRRVIGDLAPSSVEHVAVPRLSPGAVAALARHAERSPAGVYEATQGNPFFVTELLRHAGADVPATVQGLVLARFARLLVPRGRAPLGRGAALRRSATRQSAGLARRLCQRLPASSTRLDEAHRRAPRARRRLGAPRRRAPAGR